MTYKELLESKKKYLEGLMLAKKRGLDNIATPEHIEETELIIAALEKQAANNLQR